MAWPENLWGIRLGRKLFSIRKNLRPVDSTTLGRLERLGVTIEMNAKLERGWKYKSKSGFGKNFDSILDALLCYKSIYGNLLVPRLFEVPQSHPWPVNTWGLPLGIRVGSIRQGRKCQADDE